MNLLFLFFFYYCLTVATGEDNVVVNDQDDRLDGMLIAGEKGEVVMVSDDGKLFTDSVFNEFEKRSQIRIATEAVNLVTAQQRFFSQAEMKACFCDSERKPDGRDTGRAGQKSIMNC